MCGRWTTCTHAQAQQDELREAVLIAERAVLYALDFDLDVHHPYGVALSLMTEKAFNLVQLGVLRLNASGMSCYDLPQIIFNVYNMWHVHSTTCAQGYWRACRERTANVLICMLTEWAIS